MSISFALQGKIVNSIGTKAFKSAGFTGTVVFNDTLDTVFKSTTTKESFVSLKLLSQTGTTQAKRGHGQMFTTFSCSSSH